MSRPKGSKNGAAHPVLGQRYSLPYLSPGTRYPRVWDRDLQCHVREHRAVWEHYYGPVPKGLVIHHKNSNVSDNHVDNLELLPQSIHIEIHRNELISGKSRLSPERLAEAALLGWATRRRKEEA